MTAPAPHHASRRAAAVRHEVTGTLETVSAVRVGGWGPAADADLAVARDGLGRIVIPGTSLAGALRAWLGTVTGRDGGVLFDAAGLGRVFGDLEGDPCLLHVDDAIAVGDVTVEVRDGVGIDRVTGAAAAGLLYQHEVVPLGSQFAAKITAAELPGDPERVRQALDLVVGALAEGRVAVGAARTRGLGLVRLASARRVTIDLASRTDVLDWLCGRGRPGAIAGPAVDALPTADGTLGIEVAWAPVSPVMVQASAASDPDPENGREVDTVPLRTTGHDGTTRLLLPGSSVKGVLRSHAERIARTLLGITELPADWQDQLNDRRLAPVTALFGTAAAREQDAAPREPAGGDPEQHGTTGGPAAGRRGALSVHDCHGAAASERVVTHVAVDRWTGGAAENLLFSVREPAAAEWEPLRMTVDVTRPGDRDADAELALLMLVVRDLADGWLAVGFGGTRGRGTISVSRVSFTGSGLPGPWASLAGRTLAEVVAAPPPAVQRAFGSWREAMRP